MAAFTPKKRPPGGVLERFLGSLVSLHTRQGYERDLRDFFQTAAGEKMTEDAARRFLQRSYHEGLALAVRFRAALITRGVAPATLNRKLAALRAFSRFARKMGECSWELDSEALPDLPVAKYRDTFGIRPEEVAAMLSVLDPSTVKGKRDRAVLVLLWELALRRSELTGCDVDDFDPQRQVLFIRGKGRAGQKEPLELSRAAVDALQEYLAARGARHGEPLFLNLDPCRKGRSARLTPGGVYQVLRALARKAGITRDVSPHRIRHSSITAALDLTQGNVRAVQRLSRHKRLDTLLVYDDNRTGIQGRVTQTLSTMMESLVRGFANTPGAETGKKA